MSPENKAAFEPLLTLKEVAGILRFTPATIRRLVKQGEIPAMSIGKQKQYRFRDQTFNPH